MVGHLHFLEGWMVCPCFHFLVSIPAACFFCSRILTHHPTLICINTLVDCSAYPRHCLQPCSTYPLRVDCSVYPLLGADCSVSKTCCFKWPQIMICWHNSVDSYYDLTKTQRVHFFHYFPSQSKMQQLCFVCSPSTCLFFELHLLPVHNNSWSGSTLCILVVGATKRRLAGIVSVADNGSFGGKNFCIAVHSTTMVHFDDKRDHCTAGHGKGGISSKVVPMHIPIGTVVKCMALWIIPRWEHQQLLCNMVTVPLLWFISATESFIPWFFGE
jgi:hypothetical protein